jgi:hypothetical protein
MRHPRHTKLVHNAPDPEPWLDRGKKLVGIKRIMRDLRPKEREVNVVTICHGLADPDDAPERDRALAAMPAFLSQMPAYTEEACRALWRGLWVCHWHSDKPLVQLDYANRISRLIRSIPKERDGVTDVLKPLVWSACFWMQACEEWPKLDFFRIDKFLSLFRMMLYETFCILRLEEAELLDVQFFVRSMLDVFTSTHSGVAFHLCTCWLDEAAHAQLPAELLTRTLAIFTRWLAEHQVRNPVLAKRIWRNVFIARLFSEPGLCDLEMLREIVVAEQQAAGTTNRGGHALSWERKVLKMLAWGAKRRKAGVRNPAATKTKKAVTRKIIRGDKEDSGYCHKYRLVKKPKKKLPSLMTTDKASRVLTEKERHDAKVAQHPKQFKHRGILKVSDFANVPRDEDNDFD